MALARTFHVGRSELNLALPLMRQVATGLRVNVALSIADDLSMIYLDTFRESRGPLRREIAAGKRLSMATSSAGHSYIGSLRGPPQRDLLARLAKASGQKWPEHQAAIKKSLTMLARYGYCHSTSLGLEGIACTLVGPDGITYAVSLSVSTGDLDGGKMVSHFVPVLHKLVADIQAVWSEYEQSGARN
ncbi:hypothetical protein [Bordetella tumulicola]|uniref:IclR family transcriptional regulator domain-containing protein n=1 Tax=Bordetella tumulicola TaxID=1649133 RepID=UPI0039EE803D